MVQLERLTAKIKQFHYYLIALEMYCLNIYNCTLKINNPDLPPPHFSHLPNFTKKILRIHLEDS